MKYINIIKLLSVLLCIVVLFAACAKTPAEEPVDTVDTKENNGAADTEPKPEEAPLTNIEPKFENFFELVEGAAGVSEAERIDGDIVSSDGYKNFFVLKTEDIDAKNNVTETYKLYNSVSGEVTLNLTNTYFNGNYDDFSWYDLMVKENEVFVPVDGSGSFVKVDNSKNYRDKYLDVKICDYGECVYVMVRTATVTPMDEKIREENPDACVYRIETKYQYYDVYGALIVESNNELDVDEIRGGETKTAMKFGAFIAYFDSETYKLISADARYDVSKLNGVYRYENDEYGYSFNNYSNVSDLGGVRYIEIIDKAQGKVAHRYYLNDHYEYADCFLLHNGDVLIQYENMVDEADPHNCYDQEEGLYLNIAHEIFSVKEGKAISVDLKYYFEDIRDGEKFREAYLNMYSIGVTENARNLAYARAFDKEHMERSNLYVFDNDMTLVYEYEKLALEHLITPENGFGVRLLQNGDYLVDLDNVVTHQAIVKADGTVRTYIPSHMRVAGGYVYDEKNVYDYDLNLIFSLEDMEAEVYGELFGELVIKYNYYLDEDSYKFGFKSDDYAVIRKDSETASYYSSQIFFGAVMEKGEDYAVIRRGSDGKYVFLSTLNETELVTYNEMRVYSFDGGYIVLTNIEGHEVLYKIN